MTDTPTVVQAMNAAMNDVLAVGKDGRNTQQNYNFRGIDAVVNAAGPAFRRHCIVPTPRVTSIERETVEVGKNRTLMALVTVKVTYRFTGPAGDYIEAVDVPGEAMDSGDKAVSKAMSVAYRIALLQTLCIPTDEADADEHSYERAPAAQGHQEAPQQPTEAPVCPPGWDTAEAWHNARNAYVEAMEALPEDRRQKVKDKKAEKKIGWPATPEQMFDLMSLIDDVAKLEAEQVHSASSEGPH